jgi:hypothetical protein
MILRRRISSLGDEVPGSSVGWSRDYWVANSGNVTDEVWMKYIKNQVPQELDDNFKVT